MPTHTKSNSMADVTFACLALLEDETCHLYEVMFDRTEDGQVKRLLGEILVETRNHRKLLEAISNNHIGNVLGPAETECDSMGELFKQALTSTRHMRDEIVKGMPLVEAEKPSRI